MLQVIKQNSKKSSKRPGFMCNKQHHKDTRDIVLGQLNQRTVQLIIYKIQLNRKSFILKKKKMKRNSRLNPLLLQDDLYSSSLSLESEDIN